MVGMEDRGEVDAMGERWLQGSEGRGRRRTCDDGGERECWMRKVTLTQD